MFHTDVGKATTVVIYLFIMFIWHLSSYEPKAIHIYLVIYPHGSHVWLEGVTATRSFRKFLTLVEIATQLSQVLV